MDAFGKKLNFRSAISELDRRNMEVSAKRWIKKKHPSFDGDVYVENVRCFLEFPEEEKEKRKCLVNGEETIALIFSRKHLSGLYLQCLVHRKEVMQHIENWMVYQKYVIEFIDWKMWMCCFSVCCSTRWIGKMESCMDISVRFTF